jgi:Spy/CpxP family protein refolding chaperone
MKFVAGLLALAVALTVVGKLSAADDATPKAGKGQHAMHGPWDMLRGLQLTDEQKAKVHEVMKEYGPKLKTARDSILTDEQKKARDDAVKAAKDAGKKPGEVMKAAFEAVKLTDDQKTKMRETMKPLNKEIRGKLMSILTDEQKAQVKQKHHKSDSK